MERTDCQAYIDKNRCAGLIKKECENCKFYKSREEYDREMKKAMQICKEKNIHVYKYYFKKYFKNKMKREMDNNTTQRKDDDIEKAGTNEIPIV